MMRKYILGVLLATAVAMPAMAQDRDGDGERRHRDGGSRTERSEDRPARPERVERQQVADRANWSERRAARQRAVEQQEAHEPAFQQPALRREGGRRSWDQRRRERSDAIQPEVAPVAIPQADGRRDQWRRDPSGIDQSRQDRWRGDRIRDGSAYRRPYETPRSSDWAQSNTRRSTSWSNQWRSDHRYDWRRHRDGHRSLYRLGYYRDPFGSRYRRFSIGFSLFPAYYQSNYWLDDPFMYRLPQAYGPYRWVRYYGDALLVNIYTGQVVDVVYDFFW